MKSIRHIFFDLDHTLWDYDFNAKKVLSDLYVDFELKERTTADFSEFLTTYLHINSGLWHQYNIGEIDKAYIRNERFYLVLRDLGCEDRELGLRTSEYFLYHCPRQVKTMPDTELILNYLQPKYGMSIITNGFDDAQAVKLQSSGLSKYFQYVITSESIGSKKPDSGIFMHALDKVGINASEAIMIGDNPATDIAGAEKVGIKSILYDYSGNAKSTCELRVNHLSELMKLL